MVLMARYPDKYFNLAIVDPPYGIGAPKMSPTPNERKHGRIGDNSGGGKIKDETLNISNTEWDNDIPTDQYFSELFRVSKNQIIWGGNYFHLHPSRCVIAWDKVQPWENFSQWEMAWTSFDYPAALFRFDNRTGGKIHPTAKPVALYKWLLSHYAKPGDKILDTHLGSGSIAIACHDLGYDLTACELDKDYYEAAMDRLKTHQAQATLFQPEEIRQEKQIDLLPFEK
jgi:site-specific DNA-methyltransferase (adenine-specific)